MDNQQESGTGNADLTSYPPLTIPRQRTGDDSEKVVGQRSRAIRIAMIGQRGVPANSGGVERHVEELGARLAALGHDVTVYCRSNYGAEQPTSYRGMRLTYFKALPTKHFEAIAHSAAASLAAVRDGADIIHYHAVGPGLVSPYPAWLSRAKVVQTIHGLDHTRAKWGGVATAVLRTGAWLSARVPDETIVVSRALQEHYTTQYDRATTYIPNGVGRRSSVPAGATLATFGLTPGRYVLYVGRLVPEKAPDRLIEAFRGVPGDVRLVVVGSSSFSDEYVARLRRLAAQDPRVVLTGSQYGEALEELYSQAGVFVQPSDVEGLPLTLLEAAAHGLPLLASDIAPHVEILGSDVPGRRLFRAGDSVELTATMSSMLANLDAESVTGEESRASVHARFDWDKAARELSDVYARLADRPADLALRSTVRRVEQA